MLDAAHRPPHLVEVGERGAPVGDRLPGRLDDPHLPVGSDLPGQHGGEQPDAAVEVPGEPAGRGLRPLPHHVRQGLRQRRVHLPERARRQVPLPPDRALHDRRAGHPRARRVQVPDPLGVDRHLDLVAGDESLLEHRRQLPRRDERAVGDRQDVVAAVGPQPGPALGVDGEPHPVPPAQQAGRFILAWERLDGDVRLDPGQALQLLAQHRGLQLALGRRVGVLPVAAPAPPGAGPRARRLDPAGSGFEHRDRVGPAERTAAVVGDDRVHPLPRQRVPDEHDPLAPVVDPAGARRSARRARRRRRAARARGPSSRGRRARLPRAPFPELTAAVQRRRHERAPVGPTARLLMIAAVPRRPGRPHRPFGRSAGRTSRGADRDGAAGRSSRGARRVAPAVGTRGQLGPLDHPLGRLELPRHRYHHHARLEQQPGLEPQRALVVQHALPPVPDDVLRARTR